MSEHEESPDRFDQCDARHELTGERCTNEADHGPETRHSFEISNGSKVEILPGTVPANSGPHPEAVHSDEVETLSQELMDETYRPYEHEAIHSYFGLSYANYLVLNRSLLQSMPDEWQEKFCLLLDQFSEEFGWAMMLQPAINVQILAREQERKPAKVPCENCGGSGEEEDEEHPGEMITCMECDGDCEVETEGDEFETPEEVGTISDPIAHYDRGRATVPKASTPIGEVVKDGPFRFTMTAQWLKANHVEEWRKIYGPEFENGETVEIVSNTPGHTLPPVLDEIKHYGFFEGEIISAIDHCLYRVDAKMGPFEESDSVTVQLHADQLSKVDRVR